MSNPLPKADVVIVGLGAAGGIASYVLAKAGINVVGLEAGPYLTSADIITHLDEQDNGWDGAPKFNKELPTWRPDAASPTAPPVIPPVLMANMVGGTTSHYGTQNWRLRTDDFLVRSSTIGKYGEEAIPAGSTMADWPLTYDELEPFYDQVEYLIGVSGKAGNIKGEIVDGGNPFRVASISRVPASPSAKGGLHHAGHRNDDETRLPPLPAADRDPQPGLRRPPRLHVLRILRHRLLERLQVEHPRHVHS